LLTVLAPAKLNLTLEVLAERPDGFHEIRSVIQTINLCDRLNFQPGQDVKFKSSSPDFVPEKSIVSRTASLLQEATKCPKGATIEVSKRIPLVSGLGGDSSDAAAVLRGLNTLWGLGLSIQELLELASRLGSDVPFFIRGGTALVEGRGEIVAPLPPLPHMWVVLIMPSVPRLPEKTKQLYSSLTANHYTDGQITQKLVTEIKAGKELRPSLLFNTFENVVFNRSSEVNVYREHIAKLSVTDVHLAGSGPALFTLIKDRAQAEKTCDNLQKQGLEAYLAETLEATTPLE
jgi:4-diphosphocytidyl-2-C-methyl-D-erythritol kinase